jgi:anti-sigma regulatory factor (Ser/Thr protein kinase)
MAEPPNATPKHWPHGWDPAGTILASRTFPTEKEHVPAVRRLTRGTLEALPLFDGFLGEQLVSEVATNAVLHGNTDEFELIIARTPLGDLRVSVTNLGNGSGTPQMRAPELTDEGGRGLLIVHRWSHCWGISYGAHSLTVWFDLARNRESNRGSEESGGDHLGPLVDGKPMVLVPDDAGAISGSVPERGSDDAG